jgi:hypothetical protein
MLHHTTNAQVPMGVLHNIPERIDSNGVMQKGRSHIKAGHGFPNPPFVVGEAPQCLIPCDTRRIGLQTYILAYDYAKLCRRRVPLYRKK